MGKKVLHFYPHSNLLKFLSNRKLTKIQTHTGKESGEGLIRRLRGGWLERGQYMFRESLYERINGVTEIRLMPKGKTIDIIGFN